MILDRISKLIDYASMNPRFKAVAAFLSTADLSKLPIGKTAILPDGDAYINVMEPELHPEAELPFEFHRAYIDIQLPIALPEEIGWMPLEKAVAGAEFTFDADGDYALVKKPVESWIKVLPGDMIILFPEDAHAPCHGTGKQRKAVVKVRVG